MLRLGYNQNLAIGTICASGSLGTMIPPSIVLIIYGLITETSIKALFTAAFVPGFMLASFIIIYIIVRTRLNPSHAPLPELGPDDPIGAEKGGLFLAFAAVFTGGICTVLFLRALFFTLSGQNVLGEGLEPIFWGQPHHLITFGLIVTGCLVLTFFVFGTARALKGWNMGKGLVPPIIVIGVVMGSIYGGITGITEAAGMGALAVYLLMTLYQKTFSEWADVLRKNMMWIGLWIAVVLILPRFIFSLVRLSESPSLWSHCL